MSINYEAEGMAVIACLEQNGYSEKTLAEHRRCYGELWKYLSETGSTFTMDIALNWLESRKTTWSYDTYKRYRRALYRLEKYLKNGEIGSEPHCHNNFFAYQDADVSYIKLPDNNKALYNDFQNTISDECSKGTVDHYIAGCTDFLLFISERGCAAPAEMSIEHPLEYLRRIHDMAWTDETKKKYSSGVAKLLTHAAEQWHVPRCYSHVMSKSADESVVTSLKLNNAAILNTAFQPSKTLEPLVDAFLSSLDERRYSEPPQKLFGFIFTNFFLFLEFNHLEYSAEAAALWLNQIPKTASWEQKRQIITWFADYLTTKSADRTSNYVWKPLLIDGLPEWSRKITDEYLKLRQREGCERSTILMCRSSCVRFFSFLNSKGIHSPDKITPALVKEFHDTDQHATPESRNAYGARVRRLLEYMAEEGLVPQNLHLAISTQCAPKREIVTVMSEEMIDAVYSCRESAASPMELRDAAIVMIGLRMGLRSCDIVNLKIGDIDWKSRSVSLTQIKTRKAITLPMPMDVGNSVYKYISQGRPQSGAFGAGSIFIRHRAPYSALGGANCRLALNNILSAHGLVLPSGQGFHIVRRTFATRLLKARTPVDSIADSLGHATRQSIAVYLAHDEDGMRLCPLPFALLETHDEIYV